VLVGLKVIEVNTGGVTVTTTVLVIPACVAEIVTGVDDGTGVLVTGNVTFVAPDGTVTEAGTLATAGLELDRAAVAPAVSAFALRLTRLAVLVTPPTRLTGEAVTELRTAGRTVIRADRVTPP
jgi:hypothetical protein